MFFDIFLFFNYIELTRSFNDGKEMNTRRMLLLVA